MYYSGIILDEHIMTLFLFLLGFYQSLKECNPISLYKTPDVKYTRKLQLLFTSFTSLNCQLLVSRINLCQCLCVQLEVTIETESKNIILLT